VCRVLFGRCLFPISCSPLPVMADIYPWLSPSCVCVCVCVCRRVRCGSVRIQPHDSHASDHQFTSWSLYINTYRSNALSMLSWILKYFKL
jgi:hypothetical protein